MENIIKGIRQYYPVSDSSLEVLFSHMEKLELPKKHLLIRGGVADRHVYFIEKGFCRSYCLHDGEEITIWFSREGDITFAMKDLYHDEPGYEYVVYNLPVILHIRIPVGCGISLSSQK